MRVLIVGLDHQYQSRDIKTLTPAHLARLEFEQKARFRDFLQAKIDDYSVSAIGEETTHDSHTIAREIAKDAITYEVVEIPEQPAKRPVGSSRPRNAPSHCHPGRGQNGVESQGFGLG